MSTAVSDKMKGLFPVVALVVLVFISCSLSAGWEGDSEWRMVGDDPVAASKVGHKKNRGHRNTVADQSGRPNNPCATNRRSCENFDASAMKGINLQINEELKASYGYQAMATYFGRDNVGLRGFAKFFQKMSDEEHEHAHKFMNYLNKRGGNVVLEDIPKPVTDEWESGLTGILKAIDMEHHVNGKLLDLHWLAQQQNDPHLQDFLESEFLTEQVDSLKELSDFATILERVRETPLGEHIFDQELYEGKR